MHGDTNDEVKRDDRARARARDDALRASKCLSDTIYFYEIVDVILRREAGSLGGRRGGGVSTTASDKRSGFSSICETFPMSTSVICMLLKSGLD